MGCGLYPLSAGLLQYMHTFKVEHNLRSVLRADLFRNITADKRQSLLVLTLVHAVHAAHTCASCIVYAAALLAVIWPQFTTRCA